MSKTLLVVTDFKDSEFVSECAPSLETGAGAMGMKCRWLEVGTLTMAVRLDLIKNLLETEKISAALFLHLTMTREQAALFSERGVVLGCLATRHEGLHWVASDEALGGAKVAQEFLRLGHRRFGILSAPQEAVECLEREQGFLNALKEGGVSPESVLAARCRGFSPSDGYLAMKKLIPVGGHRPTAIFASAGDLVAQGALEALEEMKIRVPRDMSLAGYDNLSFTDSMIPPLTTVRQPFAAMASRLLRMLADALMRPGQAPGQQLVSPIFVSRKSCASAPLLTANA